MAYFCSASASIIPSWFRSFFQNSIYFFVGLLIFCTEKSFLFVFVFETYHWTMARSFIALNVPLSNEFSKFWIKTYPYLRCCDKFSAENHILFSYSHFENFWLHYFLSPMYNQRTIYYNIISVSVTQFPLYATATRIWELQELRNQMLENGSIEKLKPIFVSRSPVAHPRTPSLSH